MTNSSSFSWFDLNKYADVKTFDIEDWYFQLDKRRVIQLFAKENPEVIERIHISRWEHVNRNANKYISSIKEQPIFLADKGKRSILSVRNTNLFDLSMAYSENNKLEELLNSLKNEYSPEIHKELVIPPSDKWKYYRRAMLTVDLGATDEQLIQDFSEWLKTHRAITNYKVRKKRFTRNDFNKWVVNRILPYLDLTLIANAEDKTLTQNMLGKMLFPDEYDVTLAERIRKTVKPLAECLLERKTLEALEIQCRAVKKMP